MVRARTVTVPTGTPPAGGYAARTRRRDRVGHVWSSSVIYQPQSACRPTGPGLCTVRPRKSFLCAFDALTLRLTGGRLWCERCSTCAHCGGHAATNSPFLTRVL